MNNHQSEFNKRQALEPAHFYIHIPFCLRKCPYCNFCSFPIKTSSMGQKAYFSLLRQEISALLTEDSNQPLTTIYFGGGTPSAADACYIEDVLQLLASRRTISANCEITLEVNPGTHEFSKMSAYKNMGVNRLSIGLQSSLDKGLQALGRVHSREEYLACLREAKAAGFTNISTDFILAWPGQTMEDLETEIEFIKSLDLPHISLYSLIVEEGTPFGERYVEGEFPLPSPEIERHMVHLMRNSLISKGFSPYEISNYSLPGFESRHNLAYWNGENYYGAGLSASSFVKGYRRTNPTDFTDYRNMVLQNVVLQPEEYIDEEEAKKEFFIFRLRKLEGFSEEEYKTIFGKPFSIEERKKLDNFVDMGYLTFASERYSYSEKGWDFADFVARSFI